MKKVYLLMVSVFTVSIGFAQPLITYGKYNVSKDDFLKAYNKNKTPITDKDKSIRDYVELYTNFKLKVKFAQESKLDTSEQLKTDLNNFRQQIEENYLSDEKTFNSLMDEAFIRSQSDLHVLHYSVAIDEAADPADTLKRYMALQSVYDQLKLKNTKPDLTNLPDVKYTDMGYITAFSIPYQYENIVYNLKQGEVSALYRSKKAWHIFQIADIRKSIGKWKIAQILFTSPENADDATKIRAKRLADSVYKLLQNGAEFATMARNYSDDKLTYLTGGEMPEFGTGKFDLSFENEVVKLKKDNDFSAPFTTSFGIHIIKRTGLTPVATTKDDDAMQFDLKQKIMQDDRIKIAKEKFSKVIISKIGFKQNTAVSQNDLFRFSDSVMLNPDAFGNGTQTPINNKIIINFTKGNLKGQNWIEFAREYKSNPELYMGESNAEIWEKYKTISAMDYYRKHLEDYSKEFEYQIQEFKEGNLLFEVMEKQVWSKASADSIGLKKYYEANKKQYTWATSADVLIFNAVSETVAQQALDSLKAGKPWKELVEMKQGELQGDSGRFELSQINGTAVANSGEYSAITKNSDGTVTFLKYFKSYPNGDQRSFEDSKGMVINDYQNVVEKKWIEELRRKYPVKVNEILLKQLIKDVN